jgi:hypothetical protein
MSDLVNSIKLSVLGTKSGDIDKEIDSSFRSIERYSISSDRNKYIDHIKQIISKTGVEAPDQILKNLQGNPQVQNYDQSGRISRYNEYEAITRKISYCQRALETLVDNILSPDDITKRSVQYVTTEQQIEESDDIKTTIARCKKIEKKMKLDEKIKKIVRTTLKKGDNFLEILVSPKGENALTIIQEGTTHNITEEVLSMGDPITKQLKYEVVEEGEQKTEKSLNVKVQLEYSSLGGPFIGLPVSTLGQNTQASRYTTSRPYDSEKHIKSKDPNKADSSNPPGEDEEDDRFKSKYGDDGKTDEEAKLKLRDIFITVHDPKYVIRLETERFRTCLGYLVFPKIDPNLASNAALLAAGNQTVDGLCQDIINQLADKLKASNDKIAMSDELRSVILNYLITIQKNEDLKVRYVPPELMVHWRINPEVFDPYGESIFECVNFDCRLLMALKTAKTIKQLTYATDKRVIAVETGLPRDAKNIIESIKEGISKKKVSIDSMGSIDSIPSQMPTFETIYIPMRDGKRFVEIDNQQWGMNPQEDVENLKFIRDNIVANLGVPAPYLGLEENMSNRSLLTVENINFCRTIISYQKELSIPLKETFEKIITIVYPESEEYMDALSITFPEPKVSPYEHQMEYVEQMQRLIEALNGLGISKEWLKKKYLPNIDWDEVSKHAAQEKIDQETGEQPSDQEQMGMGGGMY